MLHKLIDMRLEQDATVRKYKILTSSLEDWFLKWGKTIEKKAGRAVTETILLVGAKSEHCKDYQ